MFKSKNFNFIAHFLMFFSVLTGYNAVFEYSRKYNISWVNVPMSKFNLSQSPPLNPEPIALYLCVFSLFIACCVALHRCNARVLNKEISWKNGRQEIAKVILIYFTIFLLSLIFYPIFGRAVRGW